MGNQFANSQSIGSSGRSKEHGGTLALRATEISAVNRLNFYIGVTSPSMTCDLILTGGCYEIDTFKRHCSSGSQLRRCLWADDR
jgi:hypothetical protein